MLKIVNTVNQLDFSSLMEIYIQSNTRLGREQWPMESDMEQLFRTELEFYRYLRMDFFQKSGAFYALWMEDYHSVSAVRLEPWRDGWLLEGLETHPQHRKKGYATKVMQGALEQLTDEKVYSHVHRGNAASLAVHRKNGFKLFSNSAVMIDGSYSPGYVTMIRE